jgi:hypothetical protein
MEVGDDILHTTYVGPVEHNVAHGTNAYAKAAQGIPVPSSRTMG